MLKTAELFGERDKVKIAIMRLREYEPPEGYYLAFSGGKDSIVVHHLARAAGVKFESHYNHTTVDPPELVNFIRKNYKDVESHMPELSMWKLIVKVGKPPTARSRYCCAILKEGGGQGRFVLTGVRWEESVKRAKRGMVEFCSRKGVRKFLNPIIDWTEAEVWEYIRQEKMSYCSLYDEGHRRVGCVMCPAARRKMVSAGERWPKYRQAYVRAFDKMILGISAEKRKEIGWECGEDVMRWWCDNNRSRDEDSDQSVLFE